MLKTKSTHAQIDEVNATFMDAIHHADSAAVAAVYTEDAQILPPNFPVMIGKEAIQAFWQGAMDMGMVKGVN